MKLNIFLISQCLPLSMFSNFYEILYCFIKSLWQKNSRLSVFSPYLIPHQRRHDQRTWACTCVEKFGSISPYSLPSPVFLSARLFSADYHLGQTIGNDESLWCPAPLTPSIDSRHHQDQYFPYNSVSSTINVFKLLWNLILFYKIVVTIEIADLGPSNQSRRQSTYVTIFSILDSSLKKTRPTIMGMYLCG